MRRVANCYTPFTLLYFYFTQFFTGRIRSCRPTNSVKALMAELAISNKNRVRLTNGRRIFDRRSHGRGWGGAPLALFPQNCCCHCMRRQGLQNSTLSVHVCLKSQRSMGPQQQTCGNYHTGSRNNYNFEVLKLQFVALLSPVSPVRLIPRADCEDRPHPSGVLGNPAVPIMRIESYQVSSSL